MRSSSIRSLASAAILLVVVALLGAGVAYGHHHEAAADAAEACGLCGHVAPVATAPAPAGSIDTAPQVERTEPTAARRLHEGCRSEPRGRGPPVVAPVL